MGCGVRAGSCERAVKVWGLQLASGGTVGVVVGVGDALGCRATGSVVGETARRERRGERMRQGGGETA